MSFYRVGLSNFASTVVASMNVQCGACGMEHAVWSMQLPTACSACALGNYTLGAETVAGNQTKRSTKAFASRLYVAPKWHRVANSKRSGAKRDKQGTWLQNESAGPGRSRKLVDVMQ